jgi:putative serine protease PepD
MTSPRKRIIATISVSLLAGVGGATGAALAVDRGTTTTRAIGATTSALSASAIESRAKQGVVEVVSHGPGGRAVGSGFVVDLRGDVVTSRHLVAGASEIEVRFADGTEATARAIGLDAANGLAVIRASGVERSRLRPLSLGDSSSVVQIGSGRPGAPLLDSNGRVAGVVPTWGPPIPSSTVQRVVKQALQAPV